jgi:hypothetical protein
MFLSFGHFIFKFIDRVPFVFCIMLYDVLSVVNDLQILNCLDLAD